VSDVDQSDSELDEIANLAKKSFEDLSDLGMNVDSRFAAEIFGVAGTMLGHALSAKTAKMNKKLKMIDLQMKKLKLDRDQQSEEGPSETAQGQVLNRNDILERLLASAMRRSADAAAELAEAPVGEAQATVATGHHQIIVRGGADAQGVQAGGGLLAALLDRHAVIVHGLQIPESFILGPGGPLPVCGVELGSGHMVSSAGYACGRG
jgi:hypothetical protein